MEITLQQIEDILVKHDPEDLIRMGAPLDEYSSEAADIHWHLIALTGTTMTQEYLKEIVWSVFALGFGSNEKPYTIDFTEVAQDLLAISNK